jgi:hypothetical protein
MVSFRRNRNRKKWLDLEIANLLFCQLPDEIILIILAFLNKASIVAFGQTCRRYRAIAYDIYVVEKDFIDKEF